jgi:hypothetical protein
MQRIKIEDASTDQLRAFAKDIQQIEKVPTDRSKVIAALIESGWEKDFITIAGGAPGGVEEAADDFQPEQFVQATPLREEVIRFSSVKGFGFWKKSPMVICRIMSTDRPGGKEPAHPIINNSPPLVIQRNKLVEIPYDFYLVLRQAGGTKIEPGADAKDPLVETDYQEYPMTDIQLPSPEAIAKWQAHTGSIEFGHPGGRQQVAA